jgi:hypothetical protein
MNVYEQISGRLVDAHWKLLGTGYSGRDQYRNDPEAEGVKGEGPIPAGVYKATSLELTTTTHGPYVIVLTPDEITKAHIIALGRNWDEFRIHGDEIEHPGLFLASHGCIVMSRPVREAFWVSPDHDLQVTPQFAVEVTWV